MFAAQGAGSALRCRGLKRRHAWRLFNELLYQSQKTTPALHAHTFRGRLRSC